MCDLKENDDMGFKDLAKFNIALLAKQGWWLITNLDSLLAQVLKSKYYPKTNFFCSNLKNNASFTWKSILSSQKILRDGVCWRVGIGSSLSILNDT